VIDLIARWLPADIPVELFVGWAVWLLGGLLLMLWFTRRSDANRVHPVKPVSPSAVTAKRSGTHAVARPASGAHAVARQSSGTHAAVRTSTPQTATAAAPVTYSTPKSNTPIPDAYSELSLLLDSVDDQSHSNR
jgi:hypothetical protein